MSKIAFLFPGQGAQKVGMGQAAHGRLDAVRRLFDRANQLLGYDLAQLCFEGPDQELNSTVRSQPALFVCGLAAVEVLRQESPGLLNECEAAAGLSLGEYSALVFAEVMDFESALTVVQRRGEVMQAAADTAASGMLSILGMATEDVERVCEEARGEGETLQVANLLCPGNVVVSGHKQACQRAAEIATQRGAMKAIPLAVAGAFHTPLMDSAVSKLADALADVPMSAPRIPVVSNVDARPHSDPEEIRQLLIRQVVNAVRWEESMRYLLDQGVDTFYEVGPGRVLRGLMKRIHRKASCEGVEV